MQTLRLAILTFALLVLAALTAHGQTPQVIAGVTVMAFDHIAGDTTGYELCVDGTGGSDCVPIAVSPAPDGTTVERAYQFTAPVTLQRGQRVLRVRPLWAGGTATASDAVTFRVVVAPGKPGPVRPGS